LDLPSCSSGPVASRVLVEHDAVLGFEHGQVLVVAGVIGERPEDARVVAAAGAEEEDLPFAPRLLGDPQRLAAGGAGRKPLVRVLGVAAVRVGVLAQRVEQLVDGAFPGPATAHLNRCLADVHLLLGGKAGH
jgi:hypothetical protein